MLHPVLVQGLLATTLSGGEGWHQVEELGLALLLSSAIGVEREIHQKSAGLRTHTLVGVGAAMFMLISKYGFNDVLEPGRIVLDPSRVAANYPEVVHVIPDQRRRRRVLPPYLTADCVDALRFISLFGAFHDGQLVGVNAWLPPKSYPLSRGREVAVLAHMAPIVPWVLTKVPGVLRAQTAKDAGHTHEPHVYLCEIGVNKRAQGTGAGTALMRFMVDAADEEAVGCYLTTSSNANTAWYGRFGFEVIEEFQPTPDWPTVWRMWRSPSSLDL